MASARDVADWLLEKLTRERTLYQDSAVDGIVEHFGNRFVYENENGNLAIGRDVLREFRSLTEKTVVWDRSERAWRFREGFDPPTRLIR